MTDTNTSLIAVTEIYGHKPWRKVFTEDQEDKSAFAQATMSTRTDYVTDLKGYIEVLKGISNGESGTRGGLLMGTPVKEYKKEGRKNLQFKHPSSRVVIIDIDGLPSLDVLFDDIARRLWDNDNTITEPKATTLEEKVHFVAKHLLFTQLGFTPSRYAVHLSGSFWKGEKLSFHIFLETDAAVNFISVSKTMDHRQIASGLFRDHLKLDDSGNALIYPIDLGIYHPKKILAVVPPVVPDKFKDQLPEQSWFYMDGPLTPAGEVQSRELENYDEIKAQAVKELLHARGFKANSRVASPSSAEWTVIERPKVVDVYSDEVQQPGGITRLNINGGDSHAYWYWTDDPEWVYTFKGHFKFRMKDFIPELYRIRTGEIKEEKSKTLDTLLAAASSATPCTLPAAIDQNSGIFFTVGQDTKMEYFICPPTDDPDRTPLASDVVKIAAGDGMLAFLHRHYPKLAGLYKKKDVALPKWNVAEIISDPRKPLMKLAVPGDTTSYYNEFKVLKTLDTPPEAPPKWFQSLVHHVVGGNSEFRERFYDWVAYILQTWSRPGTAWLLHGTQGTGKGLVALALQAVFGDCFAKQVASEGIFSTKDSVFRAQEMDGKFLYFADEASYRMFEDPERMDKLKNLITDGDYVSRAMRQNPIKKKFNGGFIFSSNTQGSMSLAGDDRRFFIPPRQDTPLFSPGPRTSSASGLYPEALNMSVAGEIVHLNPNSDDIIALRTWLKHRKVDAAKVLNATGISQEYKIQEISHGSNGIPAFIGLLMGTPGFTLQRSSLMDLGVYEDFLTQNRDDELLVQGIDTLFREILYGAVNRKNIGFSQSDMYYLYAMLYSPFSAKPPSFFKYLQKHGLRPTFNTLLAYHVWNEHTQEFEVQRMPDEVTPKRRRVYYLPGFRVSTWDYEGLRTLVENLYVLGYYPYIKDTTWQKDILPSLARP